MGECMDEKMKSFVVRSLAILLFLLFSYYLVRYGLPVVLPFAVAYGVSCLIRPMSSFFEKKTGIGRKVWSVVLIILTVTVISASLWYLSSALVRELKEFMTVVKDSLADEKSPVRRISDKLMGLVREVDIGEDVTFDLKSMMTAAFSKLTSALADGVGKIVSKAPSFVFFVVVLILSLFYFSADMERIEKAAEVFFSKKAVESFHRWKELGLRALGRFLRAYLSLLGITFAVLTVGFFLIGIDYPVLAALLCALVDILPVLGVGTVLVPWAVILFVMGDSAKGVSMLILFGVMYALRQILEPKIVGEAAGVHPVVALFAVFLGFRLFGVGGMILAPVLLNGARVFWEEKKKKSSTES